MPALDLMGAKLAPPTLGAGLSTRPRLVSLLQAGVQAKLCVMAAPAGSGKTTLLGRWRAASGGGRVAWMSVDPGDHDPIRFWTCVVEALRTVEPTLGTAALAALGGPRPDLGRVVLPSLLGEFDAVDRQLFLVLDDYQLVTDATCLRTLDLFLEHLPADVHVVLATRVDPPLALARLRAWGELAELRVAELQFTLQEAAELLNGGLGLGLAAEEVARLVERTEGWAVGLVLAGLALRGREDPSGFIASVCGDDRHVAGYLVAEVLAANQSKSGGSCCGPRSWSACRAHCATRCWRGRDRPSCWASLRAPTPSWCRWTTSATGTAASRCWLSLLRLELTYREPALVPVLHRRAAAWHRQVGNLQEADYHATGAQNSPKAMRQL
jgi:LuxR family maltose regulon positive regulatory protein